MSNFGTQFKKLLIDSDVTVKSWSGKQSFHEWNQSTTILITGPTGSGKSSFIEALAGRTLGISKNQLEGYTQTIAGYELVNARNQYSGPVYIIDTPGFSDNKISELEIVDMIKKWMKDHSIRYIDQVLYLYPILDVRLTGSKRRVIEMLKSLTRAGRQPNGDGGYDNEGAVTIMTTMWDQAWDDRLKKRGEDNLVELQEKVWKEMVKHGSPITRFLNTQISALCVIDASMQGPGSATETAYGLRRDRLPIRETSHGRCLYLDLVDRVQNARQRTQILRSDLSLPETRADGYLSLILQAHLEEAVLMQAKFEEQLVDFGRPPSGLEDIGRQLDPLDASAESVASHPIGAEQLVGPRTPAASNSDNSKSPPTSPPKALGHETNEGVSIDSPPDSPTAPSTGDGHDKRRSVAVRPFDVGLKGKRRKGKLFISTGPTPFKFK